MNITDPIREFARTAPGADAIILPDDTAISYRALDQHIDRFARRVLTLGLRPGQIAGLAIAPPNEALALIMALALARIGVASADMALPARHLAAAFVQPGIAPPPGTRAIPFDRSWFAAVPGEEQEELVEGREGAAVFRVFATSGTTGLRRFCPVSHADMALRIAGKGFPIVSASGRTILICAMGLGGSAGLRGCLTTFSVAGTLVFTHMAGLVNAVLRHGVTALAASPRTLQEVLATTPAGVGPLPSLRALRISGSHLPAKLARIAAQRLCPNVVTTFGSTETSNVCSGRWGEFPSEPLAIGRILPDMEVQAVDEDHQPLPPGTEGLLRIRGPGMVKGYFDDAAATRASFRDGWFYTGDRGAVTAARVMIVTGRTGDFINSGGVKVNPRVIEEVLLSVPEVTQAVAFAVPDADGLAQIWAAIVSETPVERAVLIRLCAEKLGPTAPKFIMQMPDLPRNENGKIVTDALVDFAARHYQRSGAAR